MSNVMACNGYPASMTVDTDDKIIAGRVPDVDDIMAFHGESVAAFEASLHSAIDGYTAACAQLASGSDKPASGRMLLRIGPTVHAAAPKAAAREGVSLNQWAEQASGAAARQPVPGPGVPVPPAERVHAPLGATRRWPGPIKLALNCA
ncbi:MAG: type II toxin-antitoxin system HicB family antitoxin [Bacteriovorax sp.]|nr:type II toxin-antitoxin system HicB family antitoxin [Rhizobacter sp.]